MLCWSYLVAVVTEPGRVPSDWTPFATAEVPTGSKLECCAGPN